jgi:sterol desaturase/sphingolipid hydroxylase (fatty acid hydroxylase superfamily)
MMFTAHTLVHHQLCKHDDTFQVTEEEQEEALTFQWWGGPLLVGVNLIPWVAVWAVLAARGVSFPLVPALSAIGGAIFVYYLAYEGLHYLMHKPSVAWIEHSAPFRFIERHHRLHHAHMGKNFNVVLPFADLILGTLMLRDPLPAQATGPGAKKIARRHSKFGRKLRDEATQDGVATTVTHARALQESAPRENVEA